MEVWLRRQRLIGKALTTARPFKLHSKPVFRKSARFECKTASTDASARARKRRFGSSKIVIEATCSAAGEQARGPSATTPELRARARFEHSSDPGCALRERPASSSHRCSRALPGARSAAPRWSTVSAPREAPVRLSAAGWNGPPRRTVRVPRSPAPGALTRAASPDRGGRLGAQFEAQGEVLPVT